jgi:hypothetical protein
MRLAYLTVTTAAALSLTASSFGQYKIRGPVDFLFSEDNKPSPTREEFMAGMQPKSMLREDHWLNEPLTRLDYVLINIQAHLTKNASNKADELMREYFEPSPSKSQTPSAEFTASYDEKTERLRLGATVTGVGKPKKPIKEFCRSLQVYMGQQYPLQPIGDAWSNNALGLLRRRDGDLPEYTDAATKLRESAVYIVVVTSSYNVEDGTAIYTLACRQQGDGQELEYYKTSSVLVGDKK